MAWRPLMKILRQPLIICVFLCVLHAVYVHLGCYILVAALIAIAVRTLFFAATSSVDTRNKTVLITGCDTGFGFDLARRLSTRPGTTVIAACLQINSQGAVSLDTIDNIYVIQLDVTDDKMVQRCIGDVEEILSSREAKGLWALISNAGIDTVAPVELATIEEYKKVAEVNTFGCIRVTKAFLPLVRKCKGRVVFNTSVRGQMSQAAGSVYSMTKHANECLADTLRREMKPFGVQVSIVEPGNFCAITNNMDSIIERLKESHNVMWRQASDDVKAAYGENYFPGLIEMLPTVKSTSCPTTEPVIEAMEDAIWSGTPHTRYLIHGSKHVLDKYAVMAFINPFLPDYIMDWIIAKVL